MNISKFELIDLLLGFVNGNENASNKFAEAYKNKNLIWSNDEWIYVKDIEASLKSMKKIYEKGEFEQFSRIEEIILGPSAALDSIEDSWLKRRTLDCRENIKNLYQEG